MAAGSDVLWSKELMEVMEMGQGTSLRLWVAVSLEDTVEESLMKTGKACEIPLRSACITFRKWRSCSTMSMDWGIDPFKGKPNS